MIVINPIDKKEYDIEVSKNGENQMTCPECSPNRKKKTLKCFSFNLNKNAGRCNHCGVVLVAKEDKPVFVEPAKVYSKPIWNNKTELSNNAVKWFESRKITQSILNEFKVTEGAEWMPQTQNSVNTIQFNYFKFGELVNVKYRDGAKNFKLFKDGEMIFYNLDATINNNVIIIVEGEMDVLAMAQSVLKTLYQFQTAATIKAKLTWTT